MIDPDSAPATSGARVRALPSRYTSIRQAAFRENVINSLWFVPLCLALGAMVLSRLTLAIDRSSDLEAVLDWLVPGKPAAVAANATIVAASMLTFLGVVFSTTLIAVQLAGSQYSPRIVRVFVRSRLTQFTLGAFLATFMFALNTLLTVERTGPSSSRATTGAMMYVLILTTVGMFIAYLHGMVRLMRVQYLLRLTSRASHEVIDEAFPTLEDYADFHAPEPGPATRKVYNNARAGRADHGTPRVLQCIDVGGLAEVAARLNCWVDLQVTVGEHVGPGVIVALVHGVESSLLTGAEVHQHLLFGSERTLLQDPGFGVRQLVDTASRALSPAINDPTTAVQALNRVVDLLGRVAGRPEPTGWHVDSAGVVRVRVKQSGFERLARLGLTEILRYGADAPQVSRCLASAYDDLERIATPEHRAVIERLRFEFLSVVRARAGESVLAHALEPDRLGLG